MKVCILAISYHEMILFVLFGLNKCVTFFKNARGLWVGGSWTWSRMPDPIASPWICSIGKTVPWHPFINIPNYLLKLVCLVLFDFSMCLIVGLFPGHQLEGKSLHFITGIQNITYICPFLCGKGLPFVSLFYVFLYITNFFKSFITTVTYE
jgi:hypothetical protein